ncbi:uncharacterized protein LOC127280321 [Leptopilina boulardi]|uniref:uncharacterized protein LOC127280321 n=1 Tax=Leptopilina boulardi TaxID=63433 RepID=UPI0021F56934|nr:uncharacterized protein LOC127280321 [Leptopilina boulardi]
MSVEEGKKFVDVKVQCCLEENQTFELLQDNLMSVHLPSKSWGYTRGNKFFLGFEKAEKEALIRKRIVVFPTLKVKIFLDDKEMVFSQFIKLTSIDELNRLLKCIENIEL